MTTAQPAVVRPRRGEWIRLCLSDGFERVCRFVWAHRLRELDGGGVRWCVDHGAYGVYRDDLYFPEGMVQSVTPAERPQLLLRVRCPDGRWYCVGRYETHQQAEQAVEPFRCFTRDSRIEATK